MLVLAKLFTTPLLILVSMLLSRLCGPVLGGTVAGLPFISGPASVFIACERGALFAATAAEASLMGAVASSVYCLAYAHCAQRRGWLISLLVGLLAFVVVVLLLWQMSLPFWLIALLSFVVPLIFLRLLPQVRLPVDMHIPQARWRLPLQLACGGFSVLALTWLAGIVGEVWGGDIPHLSHY